MKVSELINELQKYDPSTIVLVAKDEEGNGFHKLADMGEYWATGIDEWEQDVFSDRDVEDDPLSYQPLIDDGVAEAVLVIWP